jgi:hypothetical protein
MSPLPALLAANAVVHGIVVARFGVRNNNQPFLVFALVYAALSLCGVLAIFAAHPLVRADGCRSEPDKGHSLDSVPRKLKGCAKTAEE